MLHMETGPLLLYCIIPGYASMRGRGLQAASAPRAFAHREPKRIVEVIRGAPLPQNEL
jgi:hypothetical protein